MDVLSCQRRHFEMPPGVCFLDAAAWTPLPTAVRRAGEAGILAKARPWEHARSAFPAQTEAARAGAAALVGAAPDDIAIVGSVSHAMATAALNLAPSPGGRILRVEDEFPSLCLPFDRLAETRGLTVEVVGRPPDGDWTEALLAAIHRPGAPPLAVATLTPSHWTDGTAIDLDRLAPAVHRAGGALVIDATQAVGAMPVDVARWRPDFLAFPTYKWTLGPYGLAFLYAAPGRQGGHPLDENNGNRPPAEGARRYDRGELHDPVALPMAGAGFALIGEWGPAAISRRLAYLTDRLAEGCAALGLAVPPQGRRVPHVLGVRVPGGLPDGFIAALAARQVHASERSGALRLSPHVWVDDGDIDHCLTVLADLLPAIPR
ncbi:aminotransferase class V-fold PLP-dependent enzyme [Methylobacterium sp. J-076]|uniref:aminotransferase class V-fold PLP-dependent enzyme n=1 Tax=Methylobacterium sp. J-076 TaxID=2836655 RepID=UPI001FBBB946|nr:aminotransferase class V-fold PLP-dependent enzyme [Methylobacterium sp. J-076]MCJ2013358.1 aminotransferase class V-fold PLP-dependent enzyme [Methylobacterium sp. J-076]